MEFKKIKDFYQLYLRQFRGPLLEDGRRSWGAGGRKRAEIFVSGSFLQAH